jgi:hypothetical protein
MASSRSFNPILPQILPQAVTRVVANIGSTSTAVHMRALAAVAGDVRREAFVMAYSDRFFAIGVIRKAAPAAAH